MKQKKAVVGIGTLIIFVATIVVSMIAAGVLIQSTGLLQERALNVEESARERLTAGVEAFNVYAVGNTSTERITGLEFNVRLRSGSGPVQLQTVGLSVDSPRGNIAANLNSSKSNEDCTFDNLIPNEEFCYINRFGGEGSIIQPGDLFIIRIAFNETTQLPTFTNFDVIFTPRTGGIESLQLRTPELVLLNRIRLR